MAKRVNYKCSNPAYQSPTSGPHTNPEKAVNVGVAAHISAVSEDGPRYNYSLSSDERKSITNGIWLCQTCAKLIDSDVDKFPANILAGWMETTSGRFSVKIYISCYLYEQFRQY